jgi:2-polyprenyl-3-methyl-5-hydroxy-6-metoxy-1,4-benzoquinol methylase
MITVKTDKPIAYDSLDHIHPQGCNNDNNSSASYINDIKKYFNNKKINVLDLGCAGGQIIVDHINSDDLGVGLEGSSHVLDGLAKTNWDKYYNKNLFLCDITEPFQCLDENNNVIRFDIIQMWDVLEHIPENKLHILFKNITDHLKDDGVFLGQISRGEGDIKHISIFSKEKWKMIFEDNNFTLSDCIVSSCPRPALTGEQGFNFSAKKIMV